MEGEDCHFLSSNRPMIDGDFIRKVDHKYFDPEDVPSQDTSQCASLIAEMLRQEYQRDFKLEPCNVAMNNVPMTKIPFSRHTVTIGIGNQVMDFDTTLNQHIHVQEVQSQIAWEIEKVKEEMEKVRIIQQAWYDDFRNNKYINDLSLADIRKCGIGDACANHEVKTEEHVKHSSDSSGIMLVRNAYSCVNSTPSTTLIPRSRYLMGSIQSQNSGLPQVSM